MGIGGRIGYQVLLDRQEEKISRLEASMVELVTAAGALVQEAQHHTLPIEVVNRIARLEAASKGIFDE